MTSKPTARERFEEIKESYKHYLENEPGNNIVFLISLVEAAVENGLRKYCVEPNCKTDHTEDCWDEISERMAEGEGDRSV